MDKKTTIGFIGLGNLGMPIAENLLESGYTLHVYNRTISKAIPLKEKGAIIEDNIASLARQSDIIFSIVADDAALKSIAEGKGGLLENAKTGALHICMSTILPETAQWLEEKHISHHQLYLAAPVFGRPEAAKAKKLNFVVSGNKALRESASSLLKDAGAAGIFDFGDQITAANTVKLCGNFLIGAALEGMGESISLARQSGVDVQKMWNMFTQTLFSAPIYINYGNIILKQQFEPAAFTAKLGLKDINLVLSQAAAVDQYMPLADLLKNNLQNLVESGKDQIDWSAMFLGAQDEKNATAEF